MDNAELFTLTELISKMAKQETKMNLDDARTQKAKGIVYSLNLKFPGAHVINWSHIRLIRVPSDVPQYLRGEHFARPCPITPRHGFVESRVVSSKAEVDQVLAETLKEDPEGEVILMEKYSGQISGVATNIGVTWGLGNDGVTGIGKSVTIPTISTSVKDFYKALHISALGVDRMHFTSPYIELVENEGNTMVVQLRDGPKQPSTVDFIPKRTVVKEIFNAKDYSSLLSWERDLKAAKKRSSDGLVIVGTSNLSSHYSVHGIALDIPVVCSLSPSSIYAGLVLEPSAGRKKPLNKRSYKKLQRKIADYLNSPYLTKAKNSSEKHAWEWGGTPILTAIGSVHIMSTWDNSPLMLDLRAHAAVTLLRYAASAVFGELRHWYDVGPGKRCNEDMKTYLDFNFNTSGGSPKSRNQIYNHFLRPVALRQLETGLETATRDLVAKCTNGNYGWETNYAGTPWVEAAEQTLLLLKAIQRFMHFPTAYSWKQLVLAMNNVVHVAHNNGKLLNKWISENSFSQIAQAPGLGFLSVYAGDLALKYLDKETH